MSQVAQPVHPDGYLRADFVRESSDDVLVLLIERLTNAPDRDQDDDRTIDQLAREYARRHAPLCNVCAVGAVGSCDERCDFVS